MLALTQSNVSGCPSQRVAMRRSSYVSAGEQDPSDRIAQLRAALLTGRGPGASAQEILETTRYRPMVAAVPAPLGRALVAQQDGHLPAGKPITAARAGSQVRQSRRGAALTGAATALLVRSIAMRLFRSRRPPHW
jgi:hypothetical protein